jgi:hypothetical protein
MSKRVALLLTVVLAVSSLIAIKPVPADASIPKPSIPEFTLKFVDNSYDVPPTYGIDPYTGKNVTTQAGYHVEDKSMEVTIKNQPFAHSSDGNTYHLYYNVRTKGHFEQDWTELYHLVSLLSSPYNESNNIFSEYIPDTFPPESNSDFTVLILSTNYPPNFQVDFQVEAIVGHDSQWWEVDHNLAPQLGGHYQPAIAYDTESGWSNTQTLTINGSAPDDGTPYDGGTQQFEPSSFILGVTVTAIVVAVGAGLLLYFKKRKRQTQIPAQQQH